MTKSMPDEEALLLNNIRFFSPKSEWDRPSNNWLSISVESPFIHDELAANNNIKCYVNTYDELKNKIASTCLYSDITNDNYYLEISGRGSLRVNYQLITGGRYLSSEPISDGFMESLKEKIQEQINLNAVALPPVKASNNYQPGVAELLEKISIDQDKISAKLGINTTLKSNADTISNMLSQIAAAQEGIDRKLSASTPAPLKNVAMPIPEKPSSIIDQLSLLVIDGQKMHLPTQQLSEYAAIKLLLTKAGGTYNRKGFFSFDEGIDVAATIDKLTNGGKINVKQDAQFFATPAARAERACDALGGVAGKRILEPSGGEGALADVARHRGADVVVIENWPTNVIKLQNKGYSVVNQDFLTVTPDELGFFDGILANPPFSKGQDISHINHMMTFLKPGGTLSVIASMSAIEGRQRKQVDFQDFLHNHSAKIEMIPAGEFSESGTPVATCHITLIKPTLRLDNDNFDDDDLGGNQMSFS